jgi:hypothetical protein
MAGREKHFDDAADLLYWFEDYLEEVVKKDKKSANLAGFARHCYCSKQTLLNYSEASHTFFDAMELIRTFLEDETINDSNMGDTFKKFYMVNTFKKDYVDSQKVDSNNINHNQNDDVTNKTSEEIRQKLAEILKDKSET